MRLDVPGKGRQPASDKPAVRSSDFPFVPACVPIAVPRDVRHPTRTTIPATLEDPVQKQAQTRIHPELHRSGLITQLFPILPLAISQFGKNCSVRGVASAVAAWKASDTARGGGEHDDPQSCRQICSGSRRIHRLDAPQRRSGGGAPRRFCFLPS